MSWFRRGGKNRRSTGRSQVLPVRLELENVRAGRLRVVATLLAVLFVTAAAIYGLLFAGDWAMRRFVYENPSFAIRQIEVQTDGVISRDELRRWAGVQRGQNLLALDLARVKRDLELVSHVRSAAVERVLPDTLRLRVTEREAVARVFVGRLGRDGQYEMTTLHLDDEGYVLELLEPRQRATSQPDTDDSLPLISGINPNDLAPGRQVNLPEVHAALDLVAAFDHSSMATVADLLQVDVSSPEVLVVTTTQGSEITFAFADLDRQLRRWRGIYNEGQRISKAIARLDLAVPNYIPGLWVEASNQPPLEPKPKHHLINHRRRNVRS